MSISDEEAEVFVESVEVPDEKSATWRQMRNSVSPPEFGQVRPELPPARGKGGEAYWDAVVEHAKANHGNWIQLINPPLSVTRLQNITYALNSISVRKKDAPPALRIPGFRARWYAEALWFRYDKPES